MDRVNGAAEEQVTTAAGRLARVLEREIVDSGWPVGTLIGSESSLCERFDVGPGVVREAARILEVRGVAHRRRGPGGGLIVDEPDPERIAESVELFLDYRAVTPEQLFEMLTALEVLAVIDLVRTLDEAGVRRLRAAVGGPPPPGRKVRVDDIGDVHGEIAALCSNPAIALFLGVVRSLCRRYGYAEIEPAAAGWLHRSMHDLTEAIIAGDGPQAQFLVRRHVDRLAKMGAVRDRNTRTAAPWAGPEG